MSNAVPKSLDDITMIEVQRIVGWIGRHALPPTLPHAMPEYRTGLALDAVVNQIAAHLTSRLPIPAELVQQNAAREEWNLLAQAAAVWSDEPGYPGWESIRD